MTANSPTAPMDLLGSGVPAAAKLNRAMIADLLARLEALNSGGAAKSADARGLLTELKSLAGESGLSSQLGLGERPAAVARAAESTDRTQSIAPPKAASTKAFVAPAPRRVRVPSAAREEVYASVLYAPAPLFYAGRAIGLFMKLVGL